MGASETKVRIVVAEVGNIPLCRGMTLVAVKPHGTAMNIARAMAVLTLVRCRECRRRTVMTSGAGHVAVGFFEGIVCGCVVEFVHGPAVPGVAAVTLRAQGLVVRVRMA